MSVPMEVSDIIQITLESISSHPTIQQDLYSQHKLLSSKRSSRCGQFGCLLARLHPAGVWESYFTVRIWDANNRACLQMLRFYVDYSHAVTSVPFLHEVNLLASVSDHK